MVKNVIRIAMIASLAATVLSVTQTLRAAETKADQKRARGQIEAVDVKASTVTLKHKKESTTFSVPADVEFAGEGKKSTLADLKVGDHVVIDYTDVGGKMIAHKIGHVDVKAKDTKN